MSFERESTQSVPVGSLGGPARTAPVPLICGLCAGLACAYLVGIVLTPVFAPVGPVLLWFGTVLFGRTKVFALGAVVATLWTCFFLATAAFSLLI